MKIGYIIAASMLWAGMASAAPAWFIAHVNSFCVSAFGDDYSWNGNGTGTQSDPFQCTNGINTEDLEDPGLVFARFASGDNGEVIADGATLYTDPRGEDVGEQVLEVAPGDGGNVIVVWPEAPTDAEGGNIIVIWPEAPSDLEGGNIVLIWPALDTGTSAYRAEGTEVCGLDNKGAALWCVDTVDGDYGAIKDTRPVKWSCAAGTLSREGELALRCIAD